MTLPTESLIVSPSNVFPDPPSAAVLARLAHQLRAVEDPRVQGRVKHLLGDVLLVALFALVSDCQDYTDMEAFAQTQLPWLRQYVALANGAPSHDVFRNVFMMIKPAALIAISSQCLGELAGQHVRIDGKVSRGAKDPETGRSRLHLLRAWVGEVGLSAGQVACADKSNELEALPRLLGSLELKGAIVSIDAMGGHPEVATLIHEAGGDYILALKGNEKTTLESVSQHFRELRGSQAPTPEGLQAPEGLPIDWPASCQVHQTRELNRGRYEERQTIVIPGADQEQGWFPKSWKWAGLRSVICVKRQSLRQRATSERPSQETHYYLSSLAVDAPSLAGLIRAHWGIENTCHHLLDVTYLEDHCQVRDQTAAHNLTIFRELATKLIKDHPRKSSVKAKRKRASLSPAFRAEIVNPIFQHFDA